MSPAEAHVEAGYSESNKGNGAQERKPQIVRRLNWLLTRTAEKATTSAAVTRSEITESLRARRLRADEGALIINAKGNIEGRAKPDLSAATRCDETLAKMNGFLLDVQVKEDLDSELDGKSPEELKSVLLSMLEMVDPNMRKQILREVETADEEDLADDRIMN
jgi:hypothetical protein